MAKVWGFLRMKGIMISNVKLYKYRQFWKILPNFYKFPHHDLPKAIIWALEEESKDSKSLHDKGQRPACKPWVVTSLGQVCIRSIKGIETKSYFPPMLCHPLPLTTKVNDDSCWSHIYTPSNVFNFSLNPLNPGSHVSSKARTCNSLENHSWVIPLALPVPKERDLTDSALLIQIRAASTNDWQIHEHESPAHNLLSRAPLWDLDGEHSPQDFARDHNLAWLLTKPCPASLFLHWFLLGVFSYFQVSLVLFLGSWTKHTWSHFKVMTTHGTSTVVNLLLDLTVLGRKRREGWFPLSSSRLRGNSLSEAVTVQLTSP